jgi:hypothetical protein
MCLRRAPEKYIAGAALDRAGIQNIKTRTHVTSASVNGERDSRLNIEYHHITDQMA